MRNRAAGLFFVGLISLELSACSWLPAQIGQSAQETAVDAVIAAPRESRQALWDSLKNDSSNRLAVVLLRSMPGHAGHAPSTAREQMQALLDSNELAPAEQRLVRLRMADLQREMHLESELQQREQRLKSLIEIERDLQGGPR